MSFNAFDGDVRDLFSECGTISNLKLLTRPDGKPKGMGFVTFTTRSAMNKAIELNGEEHMGRALKVEESLKSGGGGDRGGNKSFGKQNGNNNRNNFQSNGNATIETPTLFIGGLSYQSTSDSISSFFSSIGDVQSARVVTDKETGNVIIFLFSLEDLDTLSSLM